MLMELLRREKDLGIELDDDLDIFIKVCITGKCIKSCSFFYHYLLFHQHHCIISSSQ